MSRLSEAVQELPNQPSKLSCFIDQKSGKFIVIAGDERHVIHTSTQLTEIPGITESAIHCWVHYLNGDKKVMADELAILKAQIEKEWEVKDGDCVVVKKAFEVTKCYPVDKQGKAKYAIDRTQKYTVGGISPLKEHNKCLINLNGEEFMAYYGHLVKVNVNDEPEDIRAKLRARQHLEALIYEKEQQISTTYFYLGENK